MVSIIVRGKHHARHGISERELVKQFGSREDHEYRGYNNALDCMVEGKEHFKKLLSEGGFVSFDEGERRADKWKREHTKKYDGISKNTAQTIADLRATARKDGSLSSLEGTKKACEKVGVNFGYYSKLPKHYQTKTEGGFDG